jgi:hypothetical protein
MTSNIDRYKKDLDALIARGERLHLAVQATCYPEDFEKAFKKQLGAKFKEFVKTLPDFKSEYQAWYSEAKALIRQLLPDRIADFTRHYEKPKPRKDITFENYRIEDYLQGLRVTRGWDKETIVGPDAAIPHLRQQQAILAAVKSRFESSLFDIRQLVQADLFDSELESAQALAKNGFLRAVVDNHSLKVTKKNPTIGDLNNALKEAETIDVAQWRFISHLGDLRNLCDHSKAAEPSKEQVKDLIEGVNKTTKTVF